MKTSFAGSVLMLLTGSVMMVACGDKEGGAAKIQVVMVDAPAEYDAVLIDVQEVQVNTSSDEANGWESLEEAEPGIYNLLELTNGEEAFLGEIELPAGRLGQVRLILGDQNELVIGEDTLGLTVPSGSQSGLKVNINTDIAEGVVYKLVLDFDAGRSVVKSGNSGGYNLKPVIRAQMEAQTGAIEGAVSPAGADVIVYAIQGEDSVSSYPDEGGAFLIRALAEGTYDVVAVPASDSFTKATIEALEVTIGQVTVADTLHID